MPLLWPPNWGKTWLVFILKKVNASYIKDFHPITLCNILYKILTFIKNKTIYDNIFIANELVHPMNNSNSKFSLTLLKLDLEKAFDFVSWSAIKNIMINMNFPNQFINWIMTYITFPTFSCPINNKQYNWFKSYRGVRQEIPLPLICSS